MSNFNYFSFCEVGNDLGLMFVCFFPSKSHEFCSIFASLEFSHTLCRISIWRYGANWKIKRTTISVFGVSGGNQQLGAGENKGSWNMCSLSKKKKARNSIGFLPAASQKDAWIASE